MTLRFAVLASTLCLLPLTACSDDQAVDPGSGSGGGGGDATVLVTYEDQSVDVDLSGLETTSYKGVDLVKLSDVWTASGISVDRTTLEFELVASDGFKPSVNDCEDIPGDVLDQGYIDPSSRNLTWDESLGYGGCYSVRETVEMNAHAPVR